MTNLIRCDKGHFYDAEKYQSCPYCSSSAGNMEVNLYKADAGISRTMPLKQNPANPAGEAGIGKTMPLGHSASAVSSSDNKTMAMGSAAKRPTNDEDVKTIGVIRKSVVNEDNVGINPVTGWLVCVQGRDKGRDYRIYSGNNFIGRSEAMDICIRGDDTISREKHACISYDYKNNLFYIYQGSSSGLVYHNNEAVLIPHLLSPYDLIEVGKTKLMFVPFCGEKYSWE